MNALQSIEFCHVVDDNYKDTVAMTNAIIAKGHVNADSGDFFVVIDDINTSYKDSIEDICDYLEHNLKIKPVAIFFESAFIPAGKELLAVIKDSKLVSDDEKSIILSYSDNYGSNTEFKVAYKKKDNHVLSCPLLVATSYLCRLGYLPLPKAIRGELETADAILTLLPSSYILTEANARKIVMEVMPDAKLNWLFYE